MIAFLLRAWCGQSRLWVVFWSGGIACHVVAWVFEKLLLILQSKEMPGVGSLAGIFLLSSLAALFLLSMAVWYTVAVWRCASNTSNVIWKILARLFCVIGAVATVYIVWLAFTLPLPESDTPKEYGKACEEKVLSHAPPNITEKGAYLALHANQVMACITELERFNKP